MRRARLTLAIVGVVVVGVGACGFDDGDDAHEARSAEVSVGGASGEGVVTDDIVAAGLLRAEDLDDVARGDADFDGAEALAAGEDGPEEVACGTYDALAPDGPTPEVAETSETFGASGYDGTYYTVIVTGEVVVFADAADATDALAAVEADGWAGCLRDAYGDPESDDGRSVTDEEVSLDADEGRAVVAAEIGYPAADDTGHVTSVRVARAGRALVVLSSRGAGQVLDHFGDGEPIDDVLDGIAGRVDGLG